MDLGRPLRWARALAQDVLGANRVAQARLDGSRAAVLMYHRVLPRADAQTRGVQPGMYVTPETFARHLAWLEQRYRVLPLHEIAAGLESGRSLPARACAITFDDGWRDNAEFALPELARRGMPATVFVVTERVGTPGAFWPDEVSRRMAALGARERRQLAERLGAAGSGDPQEALIERLKRLSDPEREAALEQLRKETPPLRDPEPELAGWSELDRLAAAGVDIEAHGATHAILRGLDRAGVERELRAAAESLRARGHGRHRLLAYPNGDHDELVRQVAREQGYRAAVTTERGLACAGGDPLAMPRLALHDDVSRSRAEFLQRLR